MLSPSHTPRLSLLCYYCLAVCYLWFEGLHKHLFIFLPLSFPSAALAHKRHVLAVLQRMSRGEFTALRCGRVNSMCTTGRLLEVCSLKGFVCVLQTNSPAIQTGLSSQLYRLKEMQRRKCQECLRTTREHFRFQAHHRTHILHIRLLTFQNIQICVISPSSSEIRAAHHLLA